MSDPNRVTVPPDMDGVRSDKALAVLAGVSRSVAQQLIGAGQATVNGVVPQPSAKVSAGDDLAFWTPESVELVRANPEIAFDVLFEDEHLAVVNKPPHLVVHPGAGHLTDTLVSGIMARWPAVEGVGQPGRWGIVHRLDRDTSGVMVLALTEEAYEGLISQMAARRVRRSYVCLVHGTFEMRRGTIDAPIGRDPAAPMRMAVDRDGRPARTHYRVREAFPEAEVSLLDVDLESGRTHQIRVHLASIDHPVVGDATYRRFPATFDVPRMFLHAARLGLQHPVTGDALEVEAPLPPDLSAVLQAIRDQLP